VDQETKQRFDQVDQRFEALLHDLEGRFASLAKLIEDNSQSLQREMREGFERLEAATGRNTKVLAGGTRTVAALMAWADKCDARDRKREKELQDLRARVAALERKQRRRAS
jgi:hypothetical protein